MMQLQNPSKTEGNLQFGYLFLPGSDIFENLAYEEFFLEENPLAEPVLLCWQSKRAAVIGRHQNPWKECDCRLLSEESVPLARRISGGGAVFHDLGNLNISLFVPRELYHPSLLSRLLSDTLNSLGISHQVNSRYDITIENKKVSGNAFRLYRGRALLHGTLLIDSRLEDMRFLHSSTHILRSSGTPSRPSPVCNISSVNPAVSLPVVEQALLAFAARQWGVAEPIRFQENWLPSVEQRRKRMSSREWIYGTTPSFEYRVRRGTDGFILQVEQAYIKRIFHIGQSKLIYQGQPGIPLQGDPGQTLDDWIHLTA